MATHHWDSLETTQKNIQSPWILFTDKDIISIENFPYLTEIFLYQLAAEFNKFISEVQTIHCRLFETFQTFPCSCGKFLYLWHYNFQAYGRKYLQVGIVWEKSRIYVVSYFKKFINVRNSHLGNLSKRNLISIRMFDNEGDRKFYWSINRRCLLHQIRETIFGGTIFGRIERPGPNFVNNHGNVYPSSTSSIKIVKMIFDCVKLFWDHETVKNRRGLEFWRWWDNATITIQSGSSGPLENWSASGKSAVTPRILRVWRLSPLQEDRYLSIISPPLIYKFCTCYNSFSTSSGSFIGGC